MLSLDDVLAAPQDPELLKQHLQRIGAIAPDVPVTVPTIAPVNAQPGVTIKPMTPVEKPQPKVISLAPLKGGSAELKNPNAPPPVKPGEVTAPDIAAPVPSPDAATGLNIAPMQPPKITPHQSIEAGMGMHGTSAKEEGRRQFEEMRPEITAAPGNSAHEEQRLAQMEYDKLHPWGGEISAHPGALGKIGHVLGKVGNIAGEIVAPATLANIPGTELNKRVEERRTEAQLGKERTEEREAGREKSEEELRAAQVQHLGGGTDTHNLVTDKEGNILGWKDKDGTPHGLNDPETPQAIKDMAAAVQTKVTPDEQAVAAKMKEVNPATGKNFTAYEARVQLAQDIAETKPAKPDTETQEAQRYEKIVSDKRLGKVVSAEDDAWRAAYEKRKTLAPFATVTAQAPVRSEARSDKSYQYNANALDKVSAPVEQLNARMGRLQEALNQHTPTADALVGPELLTIMAGGQGSGLRMTDAEIIRIVGGRSHWEDLQAAVNKWKLDPSKANSITEDQRKQIRALADAVQKKLTAKTEVLDKAHQGLLDTDDPKDHRRIVTDAKSRLNKIDAGEVGNEPPEGKTTVYDPKGVPHFVNSDKVDKFLKDPKYKGWSKNAATK